MIFIFQTQLQHEPRNLPTLQLNRDVQSVFDEDIELIGYNPHPAIKAPVTV